MIYEIKIKPFRKILTLVPFQKRDEKNRKMRQHFPVFIK